MIGVCKGIAFCRRAQVRPFNVPDAVCRAGIAVPGGMDKREWSPPLGQRPHLPDRLVKLNGFHFDHEANIAEKAGNLKDTIIKGAATIKKGVPRLRYHF